MAYLIRSTFGWLGGRGRRRKRRIPHELDDHTLRDIGIARAEYHFLAMSGRPARPVQVTVPDERSRRWLQ